MPQVQFSKVLPVIPAAAPACPTVEASGDLPYANMLCKVETATASVTVYGVNRRSSLRSVGNYAVLVGLERAVAGLACLNAAAVNAAIDQSSLTALQSLQFVVTKNRVALKRVGSDLAPGVGEFSLSTGARGIASFTFDAQPEEGSKVLIEDGSGFVTYFGFGIEYGSYGAYGDDLSSVGIGATATDTAASFVDAVNESALEVQAVFNADGTVSVILDTAGAGLGSTELLGVTNLTATQFVGGVDTGVTLTLGDAPRIGDIFTLNRYDADDIESLALTANNISESRVFDFMGTATAVANLSN